MKCPNCGQQTGLDENGTHNGKWLARETYLSANQYGYRKRLFCYKCGCWSDHEIHYGSNQDIVTIIRQPDEKQS